MYMEQEQKCVCAIAALSVSWAWAGFLRALPWAAEGAMPSGTSVRRQLQRVEGWEAAIFEAAQK